METHQGELVIRPRDVRLGGVGFSYDVRLTPRRPRLLGDPRLGFRMVNRPGIPGEATGSAGWGWQRQPGIGFYRVSRPEGSTYPRVAGTIPEEIRELYGERPSAALGQFDPFALDAPPLAFDPMASVTPTPDVFPVAPAPSTPTDVYITVTGTGPSAPMPLEAPMTYQPPLGGASMDPVLFDQLLAQEAAAPGTVDWSPYTLTDAQMASVRDVGLTTDLSFTAPPVPMADGTAVPWGDIIKGAVTIVTAAPGIIRAFQGPPPVVGPTGGRLIPTPQPGVYKNPNTGQTYRVDSNGNPYPVAGGGPLGGLGGMALLGVAGLIGLAIVMGGKKR